MKPSYAVLIPIAAAVVGCASPVPVAQNFELTRQKVARAAHHWDVVAEDVVSQTLQSVAEKPQLQGRGFFVTPTRNTAFEVAFRDFMITHLVQRGATVSECKIGSPAVPGFARDGADVEVRYHTQIIVHSGRGWDYQPPRLTLLASGVAVLREIFLDDHEVAGALTGVALAEWWAGHMARPTRTELIVTTTVVENNRFVMRTKDIYYVPDGDAPLFTQKVARRSMCPEDKTMAADDTAERLPQEIVTELARQEMLERDMRRTNSQWKPTTQPPAYSF
ncbi:hypothetical protein [Thauera aromatica]|uniref:hypothetical protein n=1 Tax=Thauera aromatica TaxID=59405 RepID=UPI00131C38B1|nr:hypothetical protein [Thauera aromatica]